MPGRSRFEWLYLGNSLIVIGISLVFASFALALLSQEGPSELPISLILLPFSLATLLLQYGAAFRRSEVAAVLLAALLIVGNALMAIGGLKLQSQRAKNPRPQAVRTHIDAKRCLGNISMSCQHC
jgi:hypothetical protein